METQLQSIFEEVVKTEVIEEAFPGFTDSSCQNEPYSQHCNQGDKTCSCKVQCGLGSSPSGNLQSFIGLYGNRVFGHQRIYQSAFANCFQITCMGDLTHTP
uniref:Mediator complex subunit MED23 variant MED23_i12 n=1 Tax=Homo sapiens TaxID=9606 RepID=B9TX59_HUMAN|nr:mediator complex subunit MED23 variant MED23_i12 [Homo sapiens]